MDTDFERDIRIFNDQWFSTEYPEALTLQVTTHHDLEILTLICSDAAHFRTNQRLVDHILKLHNNDLKRRFPNVAQAKW